MKWIKCWFTCKHKWELAFNIYGDSINRFGARSCWKCHNCGAVKWEQYLGDEDV